ncbi:transcription factor IBH1-like 1 [Lycium barbarum]|uniref:transcription factor IBH1-like 1 n=1 Tax=Lycium barbarum TaxID=112863 RepID=UPI00293EB52A|nr:transcription factor IBH1-like 1 [Lycium barbarum]
MSNTGSLKQEFLKKWIQGLKACCAKKKEMSIMERKKAIKLSADLAMASTRNSTTYWSHTLMANALQANKNKFIVSDILGNDSDHGIKKSSMRVLATSHKNMRSKKILKKSCNISRRSKKMALGRCIARNLVNKRTQVLKRLVPGGEYMDDECLIKETLDYILSLRVQVDVMRHLANNATHAVSHTTTTS